MWGAFVCVYACLHVHTQTHVQLCVGSSIMRTGDRVGAGGGGQYSWSAC